MFKGNPLFLLIGAIIMVMLIFANSIQLLYAGKNEGFSASHYSTPYGVVYEK